MWYYPYMKLSVNKLKAIDLFCGVGGLSLGFKNTGVEIVAAFDNWPEAISIYNNNIDNNAEKMDLSDISTSLPRLKREKFDMIIGGPPCQDFSHAGKRVENDRANLTLAFAEIVTKLKPSIFIMENVDRIVGSKAWEKAKTLFIDNNYGLTTTTLDACYCGVPQRRKRFFCIGMLNEDNDFMKDVLLKNLSDKPLTIREYFKEDLNIEYYYRHPRNYNRRGIFSIDEPSPTIRGVNRPLPKGYPTHKNDPEIELSEVRALTYLERSCIQTFPSGFIWEGTKTDIEQMIGNAVPVKLGEYVANCLLEYISLESSKKVS